ncbi:MAG: response regulator, partial [Candidatus Wallbacteria bacterium]|nr:response regulator [Candidatus Wallbacteria bacterium]
IADVNGVIRAVRPDLVVSELSISGVDMLPVLRKLRIERADSTIVVVSSQTEKFKEAEDFGICLEKPIDIKKMAQAVYFGLSMKKVVVIEENETSRHRTSRMLSENGFRVVGEVDSWHRALELCDKLSPDLLIVDPIIGSYEGYSVIEEICRSFPSVTIIASSDSAEVCKKAQEHGAGLCTGKPVNLEAVTGVITEYLKRDSVALADLIKFSRKKWRSLFESNGFRVSGEADSQESLLEIIENTAPDLVITEVNFPGMDCIEIARKMRSRNQRSMMIAVSAPDNRDKVAKLLSAGAALFIPKPCDDDQILAMARKTLEGWKRT